MICDHWMCSHCIEPTDSYDRVVDLIACEVVGHKSRYYAQAYPVDISVNPPTQRFGWAYEWTRCERCGEVLSGQPPRVVMYETGLAVHGDQFSIDGTYVAGGGQ